MKEDVCVHYVCTVCVCGYSCVCECACMNVRILQCVCMSDVYMRGSVCLWWVGFMQSVHVC